MYRIHAGTDGALNLEGEIDASCSEEAGSRLLAAATQTDPCVDLTNLRFADVAAIRAIAAAVHLIALRAGSIELRGASPTFRKTWELLQLDRAAAARMN